LIKLSKLLDENCIELDLKANKKKDVIEELLSILKQNGKTGNIDIPSLLEEMMEREKSSSTGIGNGVAIPHKLISGIDETVMAFGRKSSGINFDSIDGKPAELFFLILGQEGKSTKHLRILSKLARLLHNSSFRAILSGTKSPEEIIEAVKQQEDE